MELYFSWRESAKGFSPSCSSNIVNEDGVSPLSCLLTDDGGQKPLDTVPWVYEGVSRIISIRLAGSDAADWNRDAWGAELTKEQVKIYSLHDESYFELVKLDSFEKALLAWLSFVQLEPEIGTSKQVEI